MKRQKVKTYFLPGKPGICKKGKTRFRLFWSNTDEKPTGVSLLFLRKRRNRVLPFSQIIGLPAKSRFLLLDDQ
jgi:hypothetical protein